MCARSAQGADLGCADVLGIYPQERPNDMDLRAFPLPGVFHTASVNGQGKDVHQMSPSPLRSHFFSCGCHIICGFFSSLTNMSLRQTHQRHPPAPPAHSHILPLVSACCHAQFVESLGKFPRFFRSWGGGTGRDIQMNCSFPQVTLKAPRPAPLEPEAAAWLGLARET